MWRLSSVTLTGAVLNDSVQFAARHGRCWHRLDRPTDRPRTVTGAAQARTEVRAGPFARSIPVPFLNGAGRAAMAESGYRKDQIEVVHTQHTS